MKTKNIYQENYKTRKGVNYMIEIIKWVDHDAANYYLFFYFIIQGEKRNKAFHCVMKKDKVATDTAADALAKVDILNDVKSRLENAIDNSTPMYFPNYNADWILI